MSFPGSEKTLSREGELQMATYTKRKAGAILFSLLCVGAVIIVGVWHRDGGGIRQQDATDRRDMALRDQEQSSGEPNLGTQAGTANRQGDKALPTEAVDMDVIQDMTDALNKRMIISPGVMDVAAYLRKDLVLAQRFNEAEARQLVHQRYRLGDQDDIDLALTDLYELVRDYEEGRSGSYWEKQKLVSFVLAALDEIKDRDSDNYSAQLLRARICAHGGQTSEAMANFEQVCDALGAARDPNYLTEVVQTAVSLRKNVSDQAILAERVREIAYRSGLPQGSPLSDYLEGKTVIEGGVSLMRLRTKASNDLTASKPYFESFDPRRVDPITLEGWRISALIIERHGRGLVEVSWAMKDGGSHPEAQKQLARLTAHVYAGRSSVAAKLLNEWRKEERFFNLHKNISALVFSQLGLAMYEQGNYEKSLKYLTLAQSAQGDEAIADGRLMDSVKADIERRVSRQ